MDVELHQLDLRYARLRLSRPARERRLLADLAENGQQMPVVVVSEKDALVLIDGYLRVAALRRLGCDIVAATCWSLGELEALLLHRGLRGQEQESALEQAWFLGELRRRFGLSLLELSVLLARTKSWVSRRLASLQGKVALVTGASRGIGQAIAECFAREGARVACTARTLSEGDHPLEGSLESTVQGIADAGGEAIAVVCDVSEYPNCERAVDEVRKALGSVDVLVNNAALTYFIPIADFPVRRWLRSVAVNFHAPFFLSHLVLSDMIPRGAGAIVNVSSGAAIGPGRRAPPRPSSARRNALRRREGRARALHPGPRQRGLPVRDLGHLLQPVTDRADSRGRPPPADGGARPERGGVGGDHGAGSAVAGD